MIEPATHPARGWNGARQSYHSLSDCGSATLAVPARGEEWQTAKGNFPPGFFVA